MTDTCTLDSKKILVTGASSGIGRSAAIMASRHGATLFLTGRDETRLRQTLESLDNSAGPDGFVRSHETISADLTSGEEQDALVARLPVLDGIVHCAGIVGPLPVKFITPADIDRMFGINYLAPVNLTGRLLRKKKIADGASIVFLSTIATRNPYFGGALYSGSKAALEAYARTLALEQVQRGIRANFIMAGLVDTPMIENPSEEKMQQEALERYLKRYPLGIGKPSDVAGAIIYFLSDASKWVTGTSLILGGE